MRLMILFYCDNFDVHDFCGVGESGNLDGGGGDSEDADGGGGDDNNDRDDMG